MNKNQLTCIQNVRFIFDFFEKREWLPGEENPFKSITNQNKVSHQSVRDLSIFLATRLSKIAAMMEILQALHSEWLVTGKKDKVIMETETLDFNDALEALKSKGFTDDEYILKIEYERKWGML